MVGGCGVVVGGIVVVKDCRTLWRIRERERNVENEIIFLKKFLIQ